MSSRVGELDTDVNNYSLSELMAIVGLDDLTVSEVKKKTDSLINKYKNNKDFRNFFSDIQSQLLHYTKGAVQDTNQKNTDDESIAPDAVYPAGEKQSIEWYENEALPQSDKNQSDNITDRKQKVEIFGDYNHNAMKRQHLGVSNNFQVDVAQDTLNPNLKNTINKFVNIDSQYRQYSSGIATSSTNFGLDLSETIHNVLSIRLYSYQIPFSWYSIDVEYNNTCFWITDGSNNIPITMPSGNYLAVNFINFLNLAFIQAGFSDFLGPPPNTPFVSQYITGPDPSMNYPVYYNSYSGIISIFLFGAKYTAPIGSGYTDFIVTNETIITFFDPTSKLSCNLNCSNNTNYYNTTLGWLMGFRLPYVNVSETGNVATVILDLNGTKYLMLIVDDYNQNHINSTIVSIAEYSNKLKLPAYYSPSLLSTCTSGTPNVSNVSSLIAGENVQTIFNQQVSPDEGILIAGKLNVEYNSTSQVLPTAPRTLTQSQIYTINQINANNNNNNTNYRVRAPTNNDVLAIISVSTAGTTTGQIKTDNGSALQLNTRTYFGPVNIERLRIKLINDKGTVINLNGSDWCFTLIFECLYQY